MSPLFNDYAVRRRRMVEDQIIARGIKDPDILQVMKDIPRHLFVDEALAPQAYSDHPVSIGLGQTISQPYMVALMTNALGLKGKETVLEIGTGSGYQTAVLAKLTDWVYSIERLTPLSRRAQETLEKLKIFNVNLTVGDGTKGMPEKAPFDVIIVTAGAPVLPEVLADQLAEDGRLVIPIGDRHLQTLVRITRKKDKLIKEELGGCRFVDLVGKYGWKN